MSRDKAASERVGGRASDVTRVLRTSPEQVCAMRLAERLGSRARHTTRINVSLDASPSMGQQVVDQLLSEGVKKILTQIKENSDRLMLQAVVRVTAFSTGVRELVPWSPVEDALERLEYREEPVWGVTRLDCALEDAIEAVTRMKLAEDEARAQGRLRGARKGSVVMVLTDGYNTDDRGNDTPFPPELAARILRLQEGYAMEFLAIGVGESDERQLASIAPPAVRRGEKVAHALHYTGDEDDLDWDAVCHLIAEGSSSSRHEFRREDVVVHSGFEVVLD